MDSNMPVRILCVDDECNMLRALERSFIDEDYDIVSCTSGIEGLKELMSDVPFQIVISDYRMQDMNGAEFIKQVNIRYPETMCILLSGYADAPSIVDEINHGHIFKFILKPWDDDELKNTILTCISRITHQVNNRDIIADIGEAETLINRKVSLKTEELELFYQA